MPVQTSRQEAWDLLCEWTSSDSLRRHMLAVEAAMRAYAPRFDGDVELWGLTGLLHGAEGLGIDFDEHLSIVIAALAEKQDELVPPGSDGSSA